MGYLELAGVQKSFGGVPALHHLDLDLTAGEFVGLLGPSGCGKTTALRIVAGFEAADAGEVRVDGKDVSGVPANRRDMGMVFQAYSLFPNMTAAQNIEFGLRLHGASTKERRARAGELLELVGLSDRADRYPHQVSGGQQQRIALARALAVRPRVLLLDEPLSALDAKVRVQLRDEIRRIQTELGITTLFVTHDQEEALAISDRVGVMSQGRLEQLDVPSVVYREPATPFVAQFVGITNVLPATADGGTVVVHGHRVEVAAAAAHPNGSDVRVVVRPEEILLRGTPEGTAEGAADGPAHIAAADSTGLAGTVLTHSFLGPVTRLGVRLDAGEHQVVRVDAPSADADQHRPGDAVTLVLRPRAAIVLTVD